MHFTGWRVLFSTRDWKVVNEFTHSDVEFACKNTRQDVQRLRHCELRELRG